MKLPRGVRRLARLPGPSERVRREVDDELAFHFHRAVEDLVREGMTEEQARSRARERFGDERAYRAALERIEGGRVRMRERAEWIETFAHILTHAARSVRRNPGFTAAMVVILALGIGANAVMFGVVDRLLLSPPQHVSDPDQVRRIFVERQISNGDVRASSSITFADYRDFHEVGEFSSVGAYSSTRDMTVGRGDEAAEARVASVSFTLFALLRVPPEVGRFFTESDDALGAPGAAVLSYEYWERIWGRDPDALGQVLDIDRGRYEIVGVTPPGFTGATLQPVDIWIPLHPYGENEMGGSGWVDSRGWYWLQSVARLAPSATVEAAEAEATAAHRGGRAEMIEQDRYDENAVVLAAPLIAARGPNPTGESQVARWLAGVSLIVLLIACLNAANLLLARAIRGRREIAVRLALGVSRRRLVGELVTESVTLAALGAAAALGLAYALSGPVNQLLLPNVAFTDTGLEGRLLGFTMIVAAVAGLLAGLLPALSTGRHDMVDALRAGARGVAGSRSRARSLLLVAQAALSVVLLVGAGLFVRSFDAAGDLDLGFDSEDVAVVALEWNDELETAERQAIYEQVLERVRRVPGVRSAGLSYTIPFWSSISIGQPRVPGVDSVPRHHNGGPYVNKVGSGYFETMGLSVLQGRAFGPGDDVEEAAPLAIVSESMARAYWPEGDALGSCMMLDDEDEICTEVVGVVENHHLQALVEDDPHFLYFLNQHHPTFSGPPQSIMARTAPDAEAALGLVRAEARAASSRVRFVDASRLHDNIEPHLRSWRLGASMFTAFGLLALIVAGWGLYSVLAFDVALRRQELGIRSALGAGMDRLVRMVLRRALGLVVVGVTVGLALAVGTARFVEPLLFRVSPTDPAVYVLVAVTLVVVAVVAGCLPAWRAGRVDPTEALQTD